MPPAAAECFQKNTAIAPAPDLAGFESLLGDPLDPANPFGFARAADRDARSEYPAEPRARLLQTGFHLCCWPRELGGCFRDFEYSLDLVRLVARRDLNLMAAALFHISASSSVWIHGSPAQKALMAEWLAAGEDVGFALSEEETGGDVLGMTARLSPASDGYRLSGRKWLVGNGDRARALYVVARTGQSGPGAFSGALIDKKHVPPQSLAAPQSTPMGGLRGIGFPDIEFRYTPVGRDALVGREGQGLETAFKAQQIVRLISVSGSLGCADTGLRATVEFLIGRDARGEPLVSRPAVRAGLAAAASAMLALDISSRVAARALHTVPRHFSNWSNVVKWLGTTLSENILTDSAALLGARGVLASGHWSGVFEKARRDNQIIRFIDTSPFAVLKGIATHLQAIAGAGPERLMAAPAEPLRRALSLSASLPPFEPAALDLFAKGADPVAAAIFRELPEIAAQIPAAPLRARFEKIVSCMRDLLENVETMRKSAPATFGRSAQLLACAETYCALHAAAVCALVWHYNRGSQAAPPDEVLGSILDYLLGFGSRPRLESEAAADFLLARHQAAELYSVKPVSLACRPVERKSPL